jgi:DNA-binding SARP family transcriptional activator
LLRLLGDPVLVSADGSIKALERRAAGLLALVALEPGVTRARAAALLWPGSDDARRALRQQISRFRKNYGAELVRGDDALFVADGVQVDALQCAGGVLLGDLSFDDCDDFADWLARQRSARRSGSAGSLMQRIAQAEAGGDLEAAVDLAEQLLLVDNDSEAHHRALMRLHYLRGDIAQAQAAYERLGRLMRTRFGAQPSAETEQLARALRAAQASAVALQSAATVRPVPVTVLRPPRMIGRSRELAVLRTAWSHGRAALLLGEPGLGKSRLLAEFAADRRVLGVQGRPGDAGVPYATLARLLRSVLDRAPVELPKPRRTELARLLPELAPSLPLPADGQRLVLQGAVEAVLGQAQADGVIVDDLHFADEASVEMLQALICSGEPALAALRWALAQRPGEGSAAAAALRSALEEARALDVVALAPLTVEEMAELIDSLGLPELDSAELAPQLTKHTGGNPLYALETLKQGLASGLLQQGRLPTPSNVGALIERRLKQLSERALALARVAAIAGVDFSIALAEDVMGVRAVELADAWAELEAAQVLRDTAFAHDLVYDAVLRSVPMPIARHLHDECAEQLVRHGGEDARIARHFESAGRPARALPHLQSAAARAMAAGRHREAADFLARAVDAAESADLPSARVFDLRLELVDCLNHVEASEQQLAELDRLQQDAAARGRPLGLARVAFARSCAMATRGELAAALQAAEEGLQLLARGGPDDSDPGAHGSDGGSNPLECAARLRGQAIQLAAKRGDAAAVAVHEAPLRALLPRLPDALAARLQVLLAIALNQTDRMEDAAELHERSISSLLQQREWATLAIELANGATNARERGDFARAGRYLEDAERHLQSFDAEPPVWLAVQLALGHHARDCGRFDRALGALEGALARMPVASSGAALAQQALALTWHFMGQPARARQSLKLAALGGSDYAWTGARQRWIEALVERGLGRPDHDLLAQALELAPREMRRRVRWQIALDLARSEGGRAGYDRALDVLGEALQMRSRAFELAAECALAEIALAGDGSVRALPHGLRALTMLDEVDVPMAYKPALWLAAARAVAAADAPRAAAALRRASAWIDAAAATLPPSFAEAFNARQPVNCAVRQTLSRLTRDKALPGPAGAARA